MKYLRKYELKNMIELIRSGQPQPPKQGRITSEFRPLFDKEAYCDMVRKAKHYIKEGDIFQVVLSKRILKALCWTLTEF